MYNIKIMIEPRTLKGFRDFLPLEARKRQYVMQALRKVFESYGFEPLETPALELEDILSGKYGEEGDKLMYRFTDNGDRRVAMRYDQTVPLARVAAQYQNDLPSPFKRYQIQNVWRAENTQKGRYREFLQCDIDTLGTNSNLADAEILATVAQAYTTLGFTNFKILCNDRKLFQELETRAIITIDKLKKIGEEAVIAELEKIGVSKDTFNAIKNAPIPEDLEDIFNSATRFGVSPEVLVFDPTLARGLDYYTGLIFEVVVDAYPVGSLCGGGRYDELVGMFTKNNIPAIGCAFGFDRTIEAMDALNLFPSSLTTTQVLVTIFEPALTDASFAAANILRTANINTEIYLDTNAKMDKQLKYANKKNIPYAVIIGPDENNSGQVTVKDLVRGEQKSVLLSELPHVIT